MAKMVYKDASQPLEARVKDLLSRMRLPEKLAQMCGLSLSSELAADDGTFSMEKFQEAAKLGIGQISRMASSFDWQPPQLAKTANQIQKFLTEETRLGIPAIFHEESLSGFMAMGATNFPQAINYASTWHPELLDEVGTVIRRQMRAVGAHQALAPVLDVARDPRWGRAEETLGEDPYLVARMAVAYVKALQTEDISKGIMATLKHFGAHSFSEGGRNRAPVHVGPRELRELFLYPFEAAIKEAEAASVMNAYHEIDGVPCNASYELLSKILREGWGFQGIVVSDYGSLDMLCDIHGVAADKKDAAALSVNAGVDIELPNPNYYTEPLLHALGEGTVSEATIDTVVARILHWKFKLGLFENLFVDEGRVTELFDTPQDRQLARRVARESIVLLKNEPNLLPLNKEVEAIAVIGPSADGWRNLIGDYGYTAHLDCDLPAVPIVSILQGIRNKVGKDTLVNYAKGCELLGTSKEEFGKAIRAAKDSDIAVIVVGGKSGMSVSDTCGEGRDRDSLNLPGVQEELVKAVYETGTPTVVILVNGRPLTIEWIKEHVPTILEVWLPGEEGGNAAADVLFGDYNPGGKLPLTFPRNLGQLPCCYNLKPTSFGDYVTSELTPLFPFGHGLSYTSFEYSNLRIRQEKVKNGEQVYIRCDIQNVGKHKGDEVVQLYIRDSVASLTRPVKELKGFLRLTLEPGEKQSLTFTLSTDQLAFYNREMKLVVEPGEFLVMLGSSSEDIRLEGKFQVTGQTREVTGSQIFATKVECK